VTLIARRHRVRQSTFDLALSWNFRRSMEMAASCLPLEAAPFS
jgi:hypothetical protein